MNGEYVHTFQPPFVFEGKTYEKLTFRFGTLTGADVLAVVQEMRLRGIVTVNRTFDVDYQYRYAARCCEEDIGSDLLLRLPEKDFSEICMAAQRFLARTGL